MKQNVWIELEPARRLCTRTAANTPDASLAPVRRTTGCSVASRAPGIYQERRVHMVRGDVADTKHIKAKLLSTGTDQQLGAEAWGS